MIKNAFWITILLCSTLFMVSCNDSSTIAVKGEGVVAEEFLSLVGYDKIVFNSPGTIRLRQHTDYNVMIKEYANLFQHLETYVENRTLYIGYKQEYQIENSVLDMVITSPMINAVQVNGKGDLYFLGFEMNGDIHLNLNGQGSINVNSCTIKNLSVQLQGEGTIALDSHSSETLKVSINGKGKLAAEKFTTNNADIEINGDGTAVVNATNQLNATVNGNGSIKYLGEPTVTQNVNGKGFVSKF